MLVFSSLEAAVRAGFHWYTFSAEYRLHVVELDRATPRGRERALAFAQLTEQEEARLGHPG